MLTTINGDNGTYLNIDMWYGDEFVPGKFGASVVFSDLDAEYRGNIYSESGEMIGDFTSDDSVLVEQNFNIGWIDDDDIDHWNGVNASTAITASIEDRKDRFVVGLDPNTKDWWVYDDTTDSKTYYFDTEEEANDFVDTIVNLPDYSEDLPYGGYVPPYDGDVDHWNGVNAATAIESSDSGVCQYVRDELAKVEKTLSTTTTDPDSYNMGWLDGRRTALRDVLTHCPQDINSTTEPKYTADMCSIGASEDAVSETDYCIYYNGDVYDFDSDFNTQVAKLKSMIDEEIAKGNAKGIDFAECQVTSVELFVDPETNATDYDWDSEEVEYCADADDDYADYI